MVSFFFFFFETRESSFLNFSLTAFFFDLKGEGANDEEENEDEEANLGGLSEESSLGAKEEEEDKDKTIAQLKKHVRALQRQVRHHPQAVEFFIRNQELQELVDNYEALFGDELADHSAKIAKLQQYVGALSDQLLQSRKEKDELQVREDRI